MLENQASVRELLKNNPDDRADHGDFSAYYALRHNLPQAESLLPLHGMTTEAAALYVKNFVGDFSGARNILDAGCGAGFITAALAAQFPGARVTGVDLAEDAIEWAKTNLPSCRFEQKGVDENFRMEEKFDIIHAREFYPFTRTDDYVFVKTALLALLASLSERGRLYAICTTRSEIFHLSIVSQLDRIRQDPDFADFRFSLRPVIKNKVIRYFGVNFLAALLNRLAEWLNHNPTRVLMVEKAATQN
jgi:SAM-dependent methyltransferase